MEMYRKISKENLKKWLTELKTQAEVLLPAKENALWTYRNFDGQDIPFNFQNSRLPPKGLFLESLKALFEWKSPDGSLRVHPPAASDGQRVIFGLRACDARALKILEPVFARDYPDVFYLRNLSRTLLLGLACHVQCEGSFCGEMGIDSQDSADFDIFFREIPAGYLARVATPKGQASIAGRGFTIAVFTCAVNAFPMLIASRYVAAMMKLFTLSGACM